MHPCRVHATSHSACILTCACNVAFGMHFDVCMQRHIRHASCRMHAKILACACKFTVRSRFTAAQGFECTPPLTVSRMVDELVGELLESQATTRPVFITEHPQVSLMASVDGTGIVFSDCNDAIGSAVDDGSELVLYYMGERLCLKYT